MVNTKGELVITCSEERSQNKNRDIVLRKIQEKVDQASVAPKERKLRREVSDEVKKRWVEEKRKHSEKKQWRKGKGSQIEHFSGVFEKYVNMKLDTVNMPIWSKIMEEIEHQFGKRKISELPESNQRPLDCCDAATTV